MKTLHCADAGFDCQGVIKGSTEEDVLSQAAQHAREVHGVEVTPEMAATLRTLIRDDKEEYPSLHSLFYACSFTLIAFYKAAGKLFSVFYFTRIENAVAD